MVADCIREDSKRVGASNGTDLSQTWLTVGQVAIMRPKLLGSKEGLGKEVEQDSDFASDQVDVTFKNAKETY